MFLLILLYEHLFTVLTALGLRCRVQACSTCSAGFSWRRAQAPERVGFTSSGSRAEPVGASWAGGLLTTDSQGSQSRRTVLLTEQPHGTSWSSRRTALCSGQTPSAAASDSPGALQEALISGSSSSSASCQEDVRSRKDFFPPYGRSSTATPKPFPAVRFSATWVLCPRRRLTPQDPSTANRKRRCPALRGPFLISQGSLFEVLYGSC